MTLFTKHLVKDKRIDACGLCVKGFYLSNDKKICIKNKIGVNYKDENCAHF